ncbi:prepilin peptidase, partial [bacterium]|nr:prepilin peptidase [bacterium]
QVIIGTVAGAAIMEIIARLSYFLVKKNDEEQEENVEDVAENEENAEFDVNEYVKENKRAFGEGDTYLAAGAGAFLGWGNFIVCVFLAIIIEAIFCLPQFIKNLIDNKKYKLLFSMVMLIILAVTVYFTNIFNILLWVKAILIAVMVLFAVYIIAGLRGIADNKGYTILPFGPALLLAAFFVMFFAPQVVAFINKYIFLKP